MDRDEYDDGGLEYFASNEEEAHFYHVVSEFLDLMDVYSPPFVMAAMVQLFKERQRDSLSSIN